MSKNTQAVLWIISPGILFLVAIFTYVITNSVLGSATAGSPSPVQVVGNSLVFLLVAGALIMIPVGLIVGITKLVKRPPAKPRV